MQAKLLRVLQDREFEPLGAERTQKVDVRVIAATNRDLRQLVADGKFREDLYYRLNVIPIAMPPLRDRREDIPLLVDHFVRRFAERTGKPIDGVDEEAMTELTRYEWPGNVRELENTIERAVVLTTGPLLTRRDRLADERRSTPARRGLPSLKLHQNLEWAERETMRRALEQVARRQEGRRRADGHQPARAQPLPAEIQGLALTAYGLRDAYSLRKQLLRRRRRIAKDRHFLFVQWTRRLRVSGIDLA